MKHARVSEGTLRALVLLISISATSGSLAQSRPSATSALPQFASAQESQRFPVTTACLKRVTLTGNAQNAFSGLAAAIVLDGQIVFSHGFGVVSPLSKQPVRPSTRFHIGSVNKSLTAIAVLSLADEGRLDLHAPVTQLLPGFSLPGEPGWLNRLTAHRLISHQGAIIDSGALNGPREDGALAAAFHDPRFTATLPFHVSPGTFYNYSNTNFMVAGLVAETAAGLPYREVMQQRVFNPLNMNRAAFLPEQVAADGDFAFGVLGTAVLAPGDYDNAVARPAGFAWASIEDLAKYMIFLLQGDPAVLSSSSWKAMQSRQVNTLEELDFQGYGYGLAIQDYAVLPDSTHQRRFYDRVKIVSHGGDIAGFQALIVTFPGQGFGYAELINGDGTNPSSAARGFCYATAATEAISDRLPPPAAFPTADIQRHRFADYVGTYTDRIGLGGAVVSVTASGELRMQIPLLDAAGVPYNPILQPVSRDNFVLRIEDGALLLTGFREAGSPVVHLRTRPVVFTRASAAQDVMSTSAQRVDVHEIRALLRAAAREETQSLPKLFRPR